MSSVSSRPRVRGVSLAGAAASTALMAGAGLATVLLRSVGAAAKAAYRESSKAKEALRAAATIDSVAEMERRQRCTALVRSRALEHLPPSDALKVQTALLLKDYAVSNFQALTPQVRALSHSRSLEEARETSRALLDAVRVEHHQLLVRSVTDACVRASRQSGFDTVETRRRGEQMRVIATNRSGQALVTEIDAGFGTDLSIATEAVGIRDGSCHGVLDRFDEALESEGVIASTPRRSPTGGVCELDTARETIKKLYSAVQKVPDPVPAQSADVDRDSKETCGSRRRSRNHVTQRSRS